MSKDSKTIAVDEYREKHKRCKTCEYAKRVCPGWICEAKGQRYEYYPEGIKGCFCKLYKAKRFNV